MEDPELIHHFKGHKEGITALHFNPSRKQVMEIQVLRNPDTSDPGVKSLNTHPYHDPGFCLTGIRKFAFGNFF
jgi:hypothetical protein